MTYSERTFSLGELQGISAKTIEEHLKLYAGYVKHLNLIQEKVTELSAEYDKNAFTIVELRRRLGFEFDGMRNHEYYFEQLEGGSKTLASDNEFYARIEKDLGSFDSWLASFKAMAMTRGVGWAVLYFDKKTDQLVHAWIEEQHLGQLIGLDVLLALDMWEHSYMLDYVPSEKKKYVEAFFANLNWEVVGDRYSKAVSQV